MLHLKNGKVTDASAGTDFLYIRITGQAMKKILVLLMLFCRPEGRAQTVTVVDRVSREPLPGALFYATSPRLTVSTNNKGQADISIFRKADTIYLNMVTYRAASFSYPELSLMKLIELKPSDVFLDEVVVSANRWEEQSAENPGRIEKLGRKEIILKNPQTAADLLESGGSVYVQKSQMAGGSPMVRGFAANRVMLVVDGVRMNNAIFRGGNLQNVISVDPQAVQNSEVLFGPGAVMYGSDAIGGVMDFHTLKPVFGDSATPFHVAGSASGRFAGANSEKSGHADVNLGFRRLAIISSLSYADFGDLRAGRYGNQTFLRPVYVRSVNGKDSTFINPEPNIQRPSAYSQLNLMQKLALKTGRHGLTEYAFHHAASSNAPRYDRLLLNQDNDNNPDYAEWYYGPQKWTMHRLGYTGTKRTAFSNQLRLTAAAQDFVESRHDRRFNSNLLRHQNERVLAFSLNIDIDKAFGAGTHLFYGAEGIYNNVRSEASREELVTGVRNPIQPRYPDQSSWQAYGAYASIRHRLNEKLILSAGARYSRYMLRARFDTLLFPFPFSEADNASGSLNGSIGLVARPNKSCRVYINAATGFRAPNIDDMAKVFDSQPGFVVVPNPRLKPEYAWNAEIGGVKTVGSLLRIDVAAYYTLLNDALGRRGFHYEGSDSLFYEGRMSRVLAIQNVGTAFVYGLQAGAEIHAGNGWKVSGKISYQKGEEQGLDSLGSYPLPHVAPLFGRTGIQYARKKLLLDFYFVFNGAMAYGDLSLTDRTDDAIFARDAGGLPYVPAWNTMNFKFALFLNTHFTVTGGIENITDQLYRPFSSGISAPGRNFIISVRYKI